MTTDILNSCCLLISNIYIVVNLLIKNKTVDSNEVVTTSFLAEYEFTDHAWSKDDITCCP